ncbi:MAG: tRNA (adenosine(37)-N6)-threonylcarbamoyltransferase complex transferase subunit TsaD [Corticimicrobacter sp.]|uniref:tRNA (adenosine(37)-N6)-threonylcarbamoyltransferase complex transferase subunit TsaD n=1 Tax=Corticimicrobacter sp. TaxID=2678536 RepID=UPI0032D9C970
MIILGFESSCDETGVALACTERGLLAHALHSQIAMHGEYGGVVPELASRDHIRRVVPLTRQVLDGAGLSWRDLGAVAYTAGPGLGGALLVGASVAQSVAWAHGLPTLGIHHLEGHLLSPLLAEPQPTFPFLALLVSGGHTQIMKVSGVGEYELLGETLDDAAGEAFDKTAKLMGLPYPGGPALAALAEQGDEHAVQLPRPMLHSHDYDFSFSGLKTAVLTRMRQLTAAAAHERETASHDGIAMVPPSTADTAAAAWTVPLQARADLAAATQAAIVDVLVAKAVRALKDEGLTRLVVAGGVGANKRLRRKLQDALASVHNAEVFFPPLEFCTDNGAMIAFAAALRINAGKAQFNTDHAFTVRPRWPLDQIEASAELF